MQFSSSHPSCVVDDAPQESSALPRWFRSICVVPYPWPVESISGLGDCVVYLQWPPAPLWSALSTCLAWQIAAYSEYLLQKRLALSSGLFRCMAPDLCSILKLNSCTRFEVKGSQVLQNWRIVSPGISCVRVGPAPPLFFFFFNSILELGNAPECMEPIRYFGHKTALQYRTKAAEKELWQ